MATDERGYLLDLAGYRFVLDGDNDNEELPQRARIRLIGVTVADNGELETTDVTVSGGSGEFPETLDGDTIGPPDDNETIAYHIGSQQIVFGAQAVGELLERTGTATAGGSQKWKTGAGNPNGAVSAVEGGLFLSTDLHQLWQNTNGSTAWERVWPLQIIDATGETPVAMPARPKVRILAGTVADNSGQNSTDITPSGEGSSETYPIKLAWQSDEGTTDGDVGYDYPFTFDIDSEVPGIADGVYQCELYYGTESPNGMYTKYGTYRFDIKIESGQATSPYTTTWLAEGVGWYYRISPRRTTASADDTDYSELQLSSGNLLFTAHLDYTNPTVYCRLTILDKLGG